MKLLILITFFHSVLQAKDFSKETLSEVREKYNLPSLSYFYSYKGNIQYNKSVGVRKMGSRQEVEVSDSHHLGSCSKSMTAFLTAMLVDRGLINWDDRISKFLPELVGNTEYSEVTIEMLLAHRSGLEKSMTRDAHDLLERNKSNGFLQRREFIKNIKSLFKRKVGKYHYSNVGYIVVGHILEKVTNETFAALMKDSVFNQLNMNSCGFGKTSVSGKVDSKWGHFYSKGKLRAYNYDFPLFYEPALSVHCNFEDWSKYLNVITSGYNKKSNFLQKSTFRKLFETYDKKETGHTFGGWEIRELQNLKTKVLTYNGNNQLNYVKIFLEPKSEKIYGFASNAYHNATKAVEELSMKMKL